jgi:HEAT repeat protein
MIRRGILVLLLGFFFCTSLCLLLQAKTALASEAAYNVSIVVSPFATATQSATATPTSTSSSGGDSSSWTSPVIAVAIIVAIIGAVALWANTPLTVWLTSRSEREKEEREEQRRKEEQEKAEREQQRRSQEEQAARVAEEEARKRALDEHVRFYRERLRQDDMVSSIKILDMTKPVEVVSVYVQLKLQQDVRANATGTLAELQREPDPNVFLQVVRRRLEENYAKQAIDPAQALRDNKQCLLLGDPGAGKTTLLKYLTVQALDKQLSGLPDLPVYVELSRFAESGHANLLEFVAERWERFYGFPQAEARAYIEQQLDSGNLILLLDALDEGAVGRIEDEREAAYRRVFDAITQVATRYQKAYIVVTARSAGYRQRAPLAAFTELEVLEFRPEDIHQFVSGWFGTQDARRVQQGRDLNAQLENNLRIQTLAANPLLLSLIVLLYERLYEQHERLPERRAELYKQCVDMLLYEWDKKAKNIQRFSGLNVEDKRRMLEEVAWHFHGRHERYFPEEPLLTLIGRFLPGAGLRADQREQVLEEISADTGLLKEQAEGWYGFLHLTFQEYFVARYVLAKGLLDDLLKHRGEPWWEEVILLYAGSTSEIKPLVEKLLALEDDIFETNVMLAGRCLAANAGMDQEVAPLQQQIVTRLFEIMEGTSYAANKKRAAAVLAELGRTDEEINTRLLQLLAETIIPGGIRSDIAIALGTYGERSLVTRLLPMLFDTNLQYDTRDQVTFIIGNLGDTSTVATLLPKLQDKSIVVSIRRSIVSVLAVLGDRSLSSQLLPLLLDEKEDIEVRTQIASGWDRIGSPQDTSRLLTALFNSQISAQNNFNLLLAVLSPQNIDRSMVPQLLQLVSSAERNLPGNYAYFPFMLGQLRNPTVTDEMVQFIADRGVAFPLRDNLVDALRDTAHKSALPELRRIYADANTDQELKEEIAKTLYVLGDRTIFVDTDKILEYARLIGTFEKYIVDQMDVSVQLRLLADTYINVAVRKYIASRLATSTDASVVPPLCKLATDRVVNVDVRKSVIDTLEKIADDRATAEALWYVSRRARVRVVADELTRRVRVEA